MTVEATVSPTPAGGTVQFKDGATDLGGAVPVDANGKASLTNSYAVGAHSIVAVYSGSGVYQTSTSAPHALTVAPVVVEENTTTTLVGPSTASTGETLSFTASVSTGVAGGTVQFKESGRIWAPRFPWTQPEKRQPRRSSTWRVSTASPQCSRVRVTTWARHRTPRP